MKKVTIIGSGSFGTGLAITFAERGHSIKIWSKELDIADMINNDREQKVKLPGVKIPKGIECYTDYEESLEGSEIVLLAVPSAYIRQVSKDISKYIKKDTIIISVAKGIEGNTLKRLSEVIEEEIPQCKVAILSGPTHAEEVARLIPSTIVVASLDKEVAKLIQEEFSTQSFRIYTNSDLIGVEIGGAIKNVIALCAGISDGLKLGDNTKAALISRGIVEIARLGEKMGAQSKTFTGLTCTGDLVVTCISMHSRNRRAGILIGEGWSVKDAVDEVKMVVEGIPNTKCAYELSKKYNVEMPIVEQAYKVLFENQPAKEAISKLMQRDTIEELK